MPKRKRVSRDRAVNLLSVRRDKENSSSVSISSLPLDSQSSTTNSSSPSASSDLASATSCIIDIPISANLYPLPTPPPTSTFEKKEQLLADISISEPTTTTTSDNFRDVRTIVDLTFLCSFISEFICPICKSNKVTVTINKSKSKGFAQFLEAYCPMCDNVIKSSNTSEPKTNGSFDVNCDVVSSSLQCDLGPYKLHKLCEIINLPSVHPKTFNKLSDKVKSQATELKVQLFQKSAAIIRHKYGKKTGTLDIAVSFDGSWLDRGFALRIGIGTVIEVLTGVVLDLYVVRASCTVCATTGAWQKANNPATYDQWMAQHKIEGCNINFEAAAKVLWSRSLVNYDMRYTTMIGDGDSKAFDQVAKLAPYGPDVEITKEECVNHVSKRLGTALRSLVERTKDVTLGGKKPGSLTKEKIKTLGVYYTRAIRSNNTPESMRSAILASVYHSFSTNTIPQHKYCLSGLDTWCFYKRDLATSSNIFPGGHNKRIHTPLDYDHLHRYILPVYERLSSLPLLQRCQMHATQNVHESLHNAIWARCSKRKFHTASSVEFVALCAISEFNFGPENSLMAVPGENSNRLRTSRQRKRRLRIDVCRGNDKNRKRKQDVAIKKAEEEALEEHGTTGYEPGGF